MSTYLPYLQRRQEGFPLYDVLKALEFVSRQFTTCILVIKQTQENPTDQNKESKWPDIINKTIKHLTYKLSHTAEHLLILTFCMFDMCDSSFFQLMNVQGQSRHGYWPVRLWWICLSLKCFNNSYLVDNELSQFAMPHSHSTCEWRQEQEQIN